MVGGGDKPGVRAALERTGPGQPPMIQVEQGDLFAPPVRSERQSASHRGSAGVRGPGRPKGAGNKRTQEWCDYLDARYSSPLEGLRAVADMSPRELLVSLELWDVDPAEPDAKPPRDLIMWAFERIQWAQKEATPYGHAKLGNVGQDEDGNDVPLFALGELRRPGDGAKRVGGGTVLDLRPADVRTVEIQGDSEGEADGSNDARSNEAAKPLSDKGEGDA